jgi:hypothetical protein
MGRSIYECRGFRHRDRRPYQRPLPGAPVALIQATSWLSCSASVTNTCLFFT